MIQVKASSFFEKASNSLYKKQAFIKVIYHDWIDKSLGKETEFPRVCKLIKKELSKEIKWTTKTVKKKLIRPPFIDISKLKIKQDLIRKKGEQIIRYSNAELVIKKDGNIQIKNIKPIEYSFKSWVNKEPINPKKALSIAKNIMTISDLATHNPEVILTTTYPIMELGLLFNEHKAARVIINPESKNKEKLEKLLKKQSSKTEK